MSRYITGMRLHNWRCFKGEQVLEDLRPIPYAILARDIANPDRSNWLGKSSLLEAARWCLNNELRKEESVSSWVTKGEKEGGVDLEFSDGTFISRKREGKKGTLHVEHGGKVLTGDVAQYWIDEHLIPRELFNVTNFFEQGATDQIITMAPAQRSDMIAEWLGLSVLEEAEAVSINRLRSLEAQVERYRRRDLDTAHVVQVLADIEKRVLERTEAMRDAKVAVVEMRETNDHHAAWAKARQDAVEHQQLLTAIGYDPLPDADGAQRLADTAVSFEKAAEAHRDICKKSVRGAKLLAAGEFDGRCPAAAGFMCPATATINAQRTENVTRLEEAKVRLNDASKKVEAAQRRTADARSTLGALKKAELNRERQLARLAELENSLTLAKQKEPRCIDETSAINHLTIATEELTELTTEKKGLEDELRLYEEAEKEIEALRPELVVERAAAAVLGRGGAQREMAEAGLALIAKRANGAMARAGIPLGLKVSWGKEGKKLDTHCIGCGYYFGTSQKAKSCPTCKTARRRKFDGKLTIELDNVSGGSRDIAGLMLQLSAARWLREKRNIGLATYFIDEPFGQLDRANRLGIAAKLHSMLEQEFGARQAFIVAHDNDTLETLPARIEIVSENGFSKVSANHGS